jgi:hypothetical protein
MADGFAATYAKAIDDLAGKIFIPAVIASLLVEFGPGYQAIRNAGLIETYIVCVSLGCVLTGLMFLLLTYGSIYLYKGHDIAPFVATVIMPLGFAGLFPDQFLNFSVPYSQVTGVAILAWSFRLLGKGLWDNYI